MSYFKRNLGALVALACFAASPLLAADEGRFSLSIGSHGSLVISSFDGRSVADLPVPTVAQNVTVGGTTLQVSYGRDANGQLTAILTAPHQDSVSLHFSAGGKSIDADKAVVTVTFSPDLKGVLVDPGYVGTVEVDSHVLRARSLADDLPVPASGPSDVVAPNLPPSSMLANSETPAVASSPTGSATPEQSLTPATPPDTTMAATTTVSASPTDATALPASTANAPTSEPAPTASSSAPGSLVPLASQITPILAPTSPSSTGTPAAASHYESVQQRLISTMQPIAPGATTIQKLYWSEPITSPDGSAPAVASNEIRLVEVHGTVTIVAPGGQEQTGTEGMLVPSGATVRTADSSSAALFMGGVNSARLMPGCELVVTQTLIGPIRTNVIDLKSGAVFSRIGHREGETENYSVSTPEGVTGAEANDMMAFRGTPDDVRVHSVTKAKLYLDTRTLLAWDPAPTHGLISDVPGWDLANIDSKNKDDDQKGGQKDDNQDAGKGSPNTYFYYCQSGGPVQSDNIRHQVFCRDDNDDNHVGADGGKGGRHDHPDCKPQVVLQQILETLQTYNCKLKQVLGDIDSGTATKAEQQFYHKLTTVFFCVQEPGIVDQFENKRKKFDKNADVYSTILRQDLNEFGLPCLTPH